MKKSFLFIGAIVIAITFSAFAFNNVEDKTPERMFHKNESDFSWAMGTRFFATITKEDLKNAESALDIIPDDANWEDHNIQSMSVSSLDNYDKLEKSHYGSDLNLTTEQKSLLNSIGYSNEFALLAKCDAKHVMALDSKPYDLAYYVSVVPEKQASFKDGHDAFVEYVMSKSKFKVDQIVENDRLENGIIHFRVSPEGKISSTCIQSSCGYEEIDNLIVQVLENSPAKWEPAENANGDKIQQTLVFFYGRIGC